MGISRLRSASTSARLTRGTDPKTPGKSQKRDLTERRGQCCIRTKEVVAVHNLTPPSRVKQGPRVLTSMEIERRPYNDVHALKMAHAVDPLVVALQPERSPYAEDVKYDRQNRVR